MVTDQQVRRLMRLMKKHIPKAIAASKAGMDRKTARKYIELGRLPSEIKTEHTWRTRPDPFGDTWNKIQDMIETNPGLEATTIFGYLKRERPGEFQDGQLRTLQRRIRLWRTTEGPPKEVFFPQVHRPGELSQSDITHMTSLGVTINGVIFEHLLYHFVLTYSNWETGTICFSENFETISSGYQNAVWELGGVAKRHRTDRMSAAVNKDCNPEKFTKRYSALLRHYNAEPQRTNPARANENGDVEQRHYRFKNAVDQALILRGSRDFTSRKEYEKFLRSVFDQLNSARLKRLKEELEVLKGLPARRLDDYKPLEVTVGPSSTISVLHNTYSVHSRLIGQRIQVRAYVDHIEVWYAKKKVESIPRIRGEENHRIDYRHIIDWLVRKPGAFENYRYREDMFPSSYFKMAYDNLKRHNPLRANKEYVKILHTASCEGESIVQAIIMKLLSKEEAVSAGAVKRLVAKQIDISNVTDVSIDAVELGIYDELLAIREEVLAHG